MSPFLIASACLAAGFQKPPPDNLLYPDVPDNHFAYAILHELKADGLLPEWDDLVRGNRPLTRGQIGRFLTHAAMNLQQYVEDHRQVTGPPGATLKYSDAMTTFSGKQLTYLVALTPRLRRATKAFSGNLPSYVRWKDLDQTLDAEGKLLDGLLANE